MAAGANAQTVPNQQRGGGEPDQCRQQVPQAQWLTRQQTREDHRE